MGALESGLVWFGVCWALLVLAALYRLSHQGRQLLALLRDIERNTKRMRSSQR